MIGSYSDISTLIKQAKNAIMVSDSEEKKLIEDWLDFKNKDSINRLIDAHIPLILSIAVRYKKSNISLLDLIQEGILGLIISANKFDRNKSTRFSSYSRWWILHFINNFSKKNSYIVRTENRLGDVFSYYYDKNYLIYCQEKYQLFEKDCFNAGSNIDILLDNIIYEGPLQEKYLIQKQINFILKKVINKSFKEINCREKKILKDVYMTSKCFKDIIKEMKITFSQGRYLKKKALCKLKTVIKKNDTLNSYRTFLSEN